MPVRNITLSADDELIRRARQRAEEAQTSLNEAFRDWLSRYAAGDGAAHAHDALLRQLGGVLTDHPFRRQD